MPLLHLDDFRLGAIIGVGTVGTIYDGYVRDDIEVSPAAEAIRDEDLAIKKLHPSVCTDELVNSRFRREMTILERLQHPHIIGYFGGGAVGTELFYVMERLDGGTIKDYIHEGGPMRWPVVVDVARQVSSALQCAHNHGVIHRDLKPGNLFLTRDAQVKLGDFGIARDLHDSDLTEQGLTVGTHAYMAPEQITGDRVLSGHVDLYALGCVLFEMLTKRKVFLGDNFAQLFEQHLKEEPPSVLDFIPDCPPELDEVIRQCLAKAPESRPFNARAVQGVMIQIGERYGLGDDLEDGVAERVATPSDPKTQGFKRDVAASEVTLKGRQMLQRQIEARMGGGARPPIDSKRILIVFVVFLIAIVMSILVASQRGQ
ncbi:MAG: serine/threonine-protein kinase [Planctomycetota bacterium]